MPLNRRTAVPTLAAALAIGVAVPVLAAPSPFGVGIADPGGTGFLPWIGQMQKAFYGDLQTALKHLKDSGAAFWWLAGLSFAYGILHAAGPGHGKVVISTYVLANEESARCGVIIAFLAAMAQALVAIALVSVVAVALKATSLQMTATQEAFEIGSYALIVLLGLMLLWRKLSTITGRGHPHAVEGRHDHSRHDNSDHGHVHGRDCGHAHVPDATIAAGVRNFGSAITAILSVGIRPCSGALIVLVFALSQGIFWAGIASTFLMGLGTAMTVAVLATLAVTAKGVAIRLSGHDTARAGQVMAGLEIAGALAITALGLVLLGGALSV